MNIKQSLGTVILLAAAVLLVTGCTTPVAAAPGPQMGPDYGRMLQWANAEAGEWELPKGGTLVKSDLGLYLSWANAEIRERGVRDAGSMKEFGSDLRAYLSWANAEAGEWSERGGAAAKMNLSTYLRWANAEAGEFD